MRLIRQCSALPLELRGMVFALGNFDGVHRGHRAVVACAVEEARRRGTFAAVMTFSPHPRLFFCPDTLPFALSTLRTKICLLRELGVEVVYALRFNQALASMSAQDFIQTLLVRDLAVAHVVVGCDYVFGHNRGGDVTFLAEAAACYGFGLTVVEPIIEEEVEPCSSTRVRQALVQGDLARVKTILGRPWLIEGRVIAGQARGRTLGFPTANIDMKAWCRPARGVYAVRVGLTQEGGGVIWSDGVANYGCRPTFGGAPDVLEVHLFDFSGCLYGARLLVEFIDYVRSERVFSGSEALRLQIIQDIQCVRRILAAGSAGRAL